MFITKNMEGEGEWIYYYLVIGKRHKEYHRFKFCDSGECDCGEKSYVLEACKSGELHMCKQCWFDYHARYETYPTYQKRC